MNEFIVPQWFVWLFLFSFGAAILALATDRAKEINSQQETCPVCGQADNCGDCTHEPYNDLEWRILMRRVEEARRDLAA